VGVQVGYAAEHMGVPRFVLRKVQVILLCGNEVIHTRDDPLGSRHTDVYVRIEGSETLIINRWEVGPESLLSAEGWANGRACKDTGGWIVLAG
jgi:hypothetical protein